MVVLTKLTRLFILPHTFLFVESTLKVHAKYNFDQPSTFYGMNNRFYYVTDEKPSPPIFELKEVGGNECSLELVIQSYNTPEWVFLSVYR